MKIAEAIPFSFARALSRSEVGCELVAGISSVGGASAGSAGVVVDSRCVSIDSVLGTSSGVGVSSAGVCMGSGNGSGSSGVVDRNNESFVELAEAGIPGVEEAMSSGGFSMGGVYSTGLVSLCCWTELDAATSRIYAEFSLLKLPSGASAGKS